MEEIRLQGAYFKDLLFDGIRDIYAKQRIVASRKIDNAGKKSRSGELRDSLVNPNYMISVSGGSVHAEMIYPKSIRFQDMKHLGNWAIYNKPIWRTLYKETFRNMRYEFSDWLMNKTRRQLSDAMKPLKTKNI